jgi:hypothetical protein
MYLHDDIHLNTHTSSLSLFVLYIYHQTSFSSPVTHRFTQLHLSFLLQRVPMAEPSPRKNLSAAAAMVVLLVILTAGMVPAHKLYITSRIHTRIHNALCSCLDPSCILAEPSECWSWPDGCNLHLSGAYKGPCWPWKDDDCNRVCLGENSNNFSGACYSFQCWCYTKCDP